MIPAMAVALVLTSAPCSLPEAAKFPEVLEGLSEDERQLPSEPRELLIAARMAAVCSLATHAATPAEVDRAHLKAILDRPEFTGARERNPQLFENWIRRLGAWLESLLGKRPAQVFASGIRTIVLGMVVVLTALGLYRLLRQPRDKQVVQVNPTEPASVLQAPANHWRQAQAAIDSDPREALRQGLLTLLSALERQRLARFDRVKTNREMANELPDRGAPEQLARAVAAVVEDYDRRFYSLSPVAPDNVRTFLVAVDAIRLKWGTAL